MSVVYVADSEALLSGVAADAHAVHTVGALDLGGSSLEVTFVPAPGSAIVDIRDSRAHLNICNSHARRPARQTSSVTWGCAAQESVSKAGPISLLSVGPHTDPFQQLRIAPSVLRCGMGVWRCLSRRPAGP